MADYSVVYSLATAGGTILFNNGDLRTLDDLYWVQNIRGLDSPSLRTPVDDAPQAHGAIIHNFWKGARHVGFEGELFVQSVSKSACQPVLNGMESALRAALESILQVDGTLTWTPSGGGAESLLVRYEIGLEISPNNDYATRSFTFGLIAGSPDY